MRSPRALLAPALLAGLLLLLLPLLGAQGFLPGPAAHAARAQDAAQLTPEDYARWEKDAARAEAAVDAARASTPALETLRQQLVDWREKFRAAQDVNAAAIATVRSQLETLGPKPENAPEAPEIATQRAALEKRLAELEAPVRAAQLAYSRADALIQGIDRIIRERQTSAIFELGPSPLVPARWEPAFSALATFGQSVIAEIVNAWQNPLTRSSALRSLPLVLALGVLALVLLLRARHWLALAAARFGIDGQSRSFAAWLVQILISAGEIALPMAGVFVGIGAVYASSIVGLRLDMLLSVLTLSAFSVIAALWLGRRIFPPDPAGDAPILVGQEARNAGRRGAAMLGIAFGLWLMLRGIAGYEDWSDDIRNVLDFLVLLLGAGGLYEIGRALMRHNRSASRVQQAADDETAAESTEGYRHRAIRLLGQALLAVALLGSIAAAVGYMRAAEMLIWRSSLTIALLSLIMIVQRAVSHGYARLIGVADEDQQTLGSVLIGIAIMLLSAPLFALIWGMRVADLQDLWGRFLAGFSIGGATISPAAFLTFAIVFSIGYVLTRLLQGTLRNSILPRTRIDPGGRTAILSGIGYLGIFLSAVVAISTAGIDLSSLAIVAGALSVGIGFGLQNIVSNFVSGIILLIERPIAQGEWIEVGGISGTVRDISVRSTRIETFDRSEVIIPNSDLVSGTVINYTRGKTVGRIRVPVGVAYGTDTHKVSKILTEIAKANPMVMLRPGPVVHFMGFGADSLDFELRAILRDINSGMTVKTEIRHEIVRRFAEEGIEIPFAQRDLWLRNPESLAPVLGRGAPEQAAPQKGDDAAGGGAPDAGPAPSEG